MILAHGVGGFISWLVGSIGLRPVVRQNIMEGSMWWSEAAHLRATRKQSERDRRGSGFPIAPLRAHPLMT